MVVAYGGAATRIERGEIAEGEVTGNLDGGVSTVPAAYGSVDSGTEAVPLFFRLRKAAAAAADNCVGSSKTTAMVSF
ncbi:hypothetical protein Hanom_Chr17g01539571 [Helianthus anomalus]